MASTFFLLAQPVLAQQAAKTPDEEHEEEFAEKEARVRRNAARLQRMYGTTDLSDVIRRGLETRVREIETDQRHPLSALATPTWTSLGPTQRLHSNPAFVDGNDSGLVADIALHPTDPKVILTATAGGGVWRTTDGGTTWALATEGIGVLQVGAVAFAPSNGSIAYAGTGCADASTYQLGSVTSTPEWRVGVGLLGSSDGGATWRVVTPAGTIGPANYFFAILVDPTTPTTLLVAGDLGVQRSTDGGATFTQVLFGEANPWATGLSRSGGVIYASTWGRNLPGSIHKSTDGGVTWTEKATGLPGDAETRRRVSVAAAPSDPNRVYALIDGAGSKQLDAARSTDGGDTWVALGLNGKNVNILAQQGSSNTVLSVNPKNPSEVHGGGYDHWRSTDGGDTWKRLTDWLGAGGLPYLHADQHAHAWTADGSTLYLGNDGGLVFTKDMTTFKPLNTGTETWLISGLCHDPRNLDRIAFGAQDNGATIRISGTQYREVTTGDGYTCSFHPTNSSIINMSVQHQAMVGTSDGGASWGDAGSGITDAGEKNGTFATLLFRSATEPDRLFTNSKKRIWTTADNGLSWTLLSKQMPRISDIEDFWVSPKDPKRMAIVDQGGRVVLSSDGGVSWTHTGTVEGTSSFGSIRIDTSDATRVYLATRNVKRGEQRLYLSTDGGVTFTPISNTGNDGGLPDVPVQILEQDLASPAVWWAGTFIGLYRSGDRGVTWARYGAGLPNVPVMTLALTADGSRLRAGTHGRGIWEVAGNVTVPPSGPSLGTDALSAPVGGFTAPAAPRPGRRAKFVDTSTGSPSSWTWNFGDGGTSRDRSPYHVYAAAGKYNVSLTVSNSAGTATAVSKEVTVAYPDTGTGALLTYLLPVVLTSSGAGGTQFSTELTMTNRSTASMFLTFKVKGTFEATSPEYELIPGQDVWPDVFVFLKEIGMVVPSGNLVTSMRIEVRGAGNVGQFGAQVRVTTPPNQDQRAQGIAGRFGLSFPALPLGTGASKEVAVYGLQQTSNPGSAGTRANLACVNAGGGVAGTAPLTLEVTYHDGDTGKSHPSKDTFNLTSFQFEQKSQPLAARGIKNAFATIKRTAGTEQFVCYGVLNDNLNGDGSFVPMVVTDPPSETTEAMVPVIVGTSTFRSELTLTNRSENTVEGQFGVVPSGNPQPIYGDFELEAGGQLVIPDIVANLNGQGFDLTGNVVASMFFEFEEASHQDTASGFKPLPTSQVYVGVRTYAQKAGGLFGLAYGYSPSGTAADTEAFVYGLQQLGVQGQDGGTRSNLAVIHAYGGKEENLQLEVTYFDAYNVELGKEVCTPAPCTLKPGEFRQFNSPLARYTGITSGYARIRKLSGSDQFLAYGVLNDQANDDGSYVPMSIP